MNQISNNFHAKYTPPTSSIRTGEQMTAYIKEHQNDEGFDMRGKSWSSLYVENPNVQRNSSSIFSSSEVNNKRTSLLNNTQVSKVSIVTQLQSSSEAVNTIINNNITEGIKEVFSRFDINGEVSSAIKNYQYNEPLSEVNSLVSQGINELQKKGADSKTLDKFLYQLSTAIDEKTTRSIDEISAIPALSNKVSIQEEDGVSQKNIPTLRVWQSHDTQEKVVRQSFEITNNNGDIVKINAEYNQQNSITTDEYNSVKKGVNVNITEGDLSEEERIQFNQFLDDFASVTNEILEGDLEAANQAFTSLDITDYGFKSITKDDSSYEKVMNEDIIHSYNKELGHVHTGEEVQTSDQSNIVHNSYIKGGALHNVQRNADSNLANFDMKYANTHEIGSSSINKDLRYDGQQDELFGLSQQYGKSRDGLVLQDNQGDLYQYQYNEKNREDSGWAKIDKEQVNYQALKENQRFNSFKLNTEDSNNITLTHLATNSVKDYGTSLVSEPANKQYSDKYENQVFEDKSGNLYQYQFNGDYQSSGWSKVEASEEILKLFEDRFENEGYIHDYLDVDERTNSMQFATLRNGREDLTQSDSNINMQILPTK